MNLPVIESNTKQPPAASAKRHLLDLTTAQLKEWLAEIGQPAFRAKQIQNWVFHRRVHDFAQMSDLPQKLREHLAEAFDVFIASEAHVVTSSDGTDKILVACWQDYVEESGVTFHTRHISYAFYNRDRCPK